MPYDRGPEAAAATHRYRLPCDRDLEAASPTRGPDRKAGDNDGSPRPPRALDRKARENAEAEALDVVLSEAVAEHGREAVYEIDTTDRPPAAVAADVEAVVAGDREPTAGTVDFTDYL